MPQILIRQFDELEGVSAVEHDARALHLIKLYREDIRRVVEFLDREIDGQRVA